MKHVVLTFLANMVKEEKTMLKMYKESGTTNRKQFYQSMRDTVMGDINQELDTVLMGGRWKWLLPFDFDAGCHICCQCTARAAPLHLLCGDNLERGLPATQGRLLGHTRDDVANDSLQVVLAPLR